MSTRQSTALRLLAIPLLVTLASSPTLAQSGDADPTGATDAPAEEAKTVLGRLLITTDSVARIIVNGEDLGLLQVGDLLEHDVEEAEGTVQAKSPEASAATLSKSYAFEATDGEEDETEGDPATVEIQFKMAKAIREARKKERKEGVYPDFRSGLMWRRKDNGADVTWRSATRYCLDLDFGGWSDWRLPKIEELETLQAMWSQAPFKTVDPVLLSDCCPWSSAEIDTDSAWNYNFRFRRAFEGRKGFSYGLRALCVRDLTLAEIEEHEAAIAERKKKKKRKKADEEADGEELILGTVDDVSGDKPPGR